MNRQNMLRITLFISVLAFNPAVAQTLNQRTLSAIETQEQKSLGSDISKTLMEKGLEKYSISWGSSSIPWRRSTF